MACAVIFFATVEAFIYAAMIQAGLQTLVLLVYLQSSVFRVSGRASMLNFSASRFFTRCRSAWRVFSGFCKPTFTIILSAIVSARPNLPIYAFGCFQLPLIAMLSESVTSVLIPRMSELQARDDKPEMIRLTVRAMQKLAFFYFPDLHFSFDYGASLYHHAFYRKITRRAFRFF